MICRLCRGTGHLLADDAACRSEACPGCEVYFGNDFSGCPVWVSTGRINGPTPAEVEWEYGDPVG